MILNNKTFDSIKTKAQQLNSKINRVTYSGGDPNGAWFDCVQVSPNGSPRLGARILIDEEFDWVDVKPLIYFVGIQNYDRCFSCKVTLLLRKRVITDIKREVVE